MKNSGISILIIILLVVIFLILGIIIGYYLLKYNQGIPTSFSTPTSNTELSEAKLKQTICNQAKPECVATDFSNAKIGDCVCVIQKISGNSAMGGINSKVDEVGGPGYIFLATKINDKWTPVLEGQDLFKCSDLEKFAIDKDIIYKCLDENSKEVNY